MLSIIICHRNKEYLEGIKKSIEATIGIPYELIVIDNTNNTHTIFSAYNEGVKISKYDILCFTHEDIVHHTRNWGEKVLNHFNNPKVGMIGILGGLSQSAIPSAWWYNNYFAKSARNFLMRTPNTKDKKLYRYYSNPYEDKGKTEVVIIDGVWFCIRKSLFAKIKFDEINFSGFHLYDADISLQVLEHAKNYVVYDILVDHFWKGKITPDYYFELEKFANKWEHTLPIQNSKIEHTYMNIYNWHALRSLLLEIKSTDIPKEYAVQLLKKYYPVVKKQYNSYWFRGYFFLSQFLGYKFTNSIFYRIEKLTGLCKLPGYKKFETEDEYIL